jgi:hypothetical protein
MNDKTTSCNALVGIPSALMNLINAEIAFGRDLIQSLTGLEVPSAVDTFREARGRATKTCCRIPPPCWMPRPLGECISHVGQCKSACIRFVVTNCDRVSRTVTVEATPKTVSLTMTPPSLTLGPMARGSISVCVAIGGEVPDGTIYETLIWLRGCHEHFLRWTVSVGTVGLDSCHEIAVDDCPDLIHHWYDHFYCVRGCSTVRRTPETGVVHG